MSHFPFKVVAGPGDKPMIEGEPQAASPAFLSAFLSLNWFQSVVASWWL
jgi:hypothetical protein